MRKLHLFFCLINAFFLFAAMPALAGSCVDTTDATVAIPESTWTVIVKHYECYAAGGGRTSVVAVDSKKKLKDIITVGELVNITVTATDSHNIDVQMPNLVDVISRSDGFEDIHVNYKFLPRYDAADQELYKLWLHHPDDPQAIKWRKKLKERKAAERTQAGVPAAQ